MVGFELVEVGLVEPGLAGFVDVVGFELVGPELVGFVGIVGFELVGFELLEFVDGDVCATGGSTTGIKLGSGREDGAVESGWGIWGGAVSGTVVRSVTLGSITMGDDC